MLIKVHLFDQKCNFISVIAKLNFQKPLLEFLQKYEAVFRNVS